MGANFSKFQGDAQVSTTNSPTKFYLNATFSLQTFKFHWIILLETETLFGN